LRINQQIDDFNAMTLVQQLKSPQVSTWLQLSLSHSTNVSNMLSLKWLRLAERMSSAMLN